jgi:hypothetical protein
MTVSFITCGAGVAPQAARPEASIVKTINNANDLARFPFILSSLSNEAIGCDLGHLEFAARRSSITETWHHANSL